MLETSLEIKTVTWLLIWELIFIVGQQMVVLGTSFRVQVFFSTDCICTRNGRKEFRMTPQFLSKATKCTNGYTKKTSSIRKHTRVYHIQLNSFGYTSLFCNNFEHYEKYHTEEEISLSLFRYNYLLLCETDFPYQEQSERAKPIMLSL